MSKITAPIASATSVAQLGELLGAASLRLDAEAVGELDAAGALSRAAAA
jgi:aryl-alcohol dehydrogenase-like predicted oxidoreductase